jgi:signal transduction histidine kinase
MMPPAKPGTLERLIRLAARSTAAERLVRLVARVPATIHAKLLAAFLIIVVLLITVGAVGLQVLSEVNHRSEDLVKLQRKIAAYRQLQHDTTSQLYSVSTALLVPDEKTLEATLRQLNQFGYDLDRLQFVAKDEVEVLAQVRENYDEFVEVVTRVVDLIRVGKVAEGRELQLAQAGPLADRLERLTNQLVNRAEADIVSSIEVSQRAYVVSRWTVIGFAFGSIALALLLGYVISWSVIAPVKQMDAHLRQIGSGDFSRRVTVPNRDELGTLAANLNRMNAELGTLYQQLEAASRHKSQFLANMSHELRTPLNAILGYTELILDGIYGEIPLKIRDVLERVRHSGRHLLELINDVLDLSRIEAGQLMLLLKDFSFKEVVQTVFTAVEPLAAEKHLALKVSVPSDLPPARGDERRVTQVLLNLVGNAIKFTDVGDVRIQATASNGELVVSVTDTGSGIAASDRERIFEEFQQGEDNHARAAGGTGLGLPIAKRIIALHGGRMWVESSQGKGSTFWFTLPVSPEQEPHS